ncbi:type I 3-dehydroquinate dehydratase [Halanaeroarchaeum sulfurireducens]|uniref:3-dehydroquinate dehydratase n=1 Tax=Halanaeroarchaeum sulfurireducens TaxID=1604004 RepID=A0A0F7PCP0_9EURY|nr:type I 3-dehydroquinate dehydratase [Halanaeroarchaeum sulfurireducens]AKH97123.1 3-dehydroquinate dehydratase I [Halanaeroarchaeum sulfurireducens]ALG81524.1 3-dehydroquinate dehydratase I [Halanaeroarchaeum sulfurireducens]
MDFDGFVLAASTGDLSEESAAREHADALEFRMDLAEDPLAVLDDYSGTLPLLVTNRPRWEGGERADDPDRIDELLEAMAVEAVEAVDVELDALTDDTDHQDATEVLAAARTGDVSTVVSTHDFDGTPPMNELADSLGHVCSLGDVGKLAVTAEHTGEVLDLLRVTYEFSRADERVATMAMGQPGRHSRVVAPLYGSSIGYAPVDPAEATAPGQYDLAQLRTLVDALL